MAEIDLSKMGLTLTGLVYDKKIDKTPKGDRHRLVISTPGLEKQLSVSVMPDEYNKVNVGGTFTGRISLRLFNGSLYCDKVA